MHARATTLAIAIAAATALAACIAIPAAHAAGYEVF